MNRESFAQAVSSILVKNKVISESEARNLSKSFENYSKPAFDQFLLEEGIVSKGDLLKALGEYFETPYFNTVAHFFVHDLIRLFPKGFLLRNGLIPLEIDQNIMIMVASNPNDPELLPKVGKHVPYDVRFYVGIRRDIEDAVREYYDNPPTYVPKSLRDY